MARDVAPQPRFSAGQPPSVIGASNQATKWRSRVAVFMLAIGGMATAAWMAMLSVLAARALLSEFW
jgi:hypothetical protein